jgi:hypothetical protein
VLVRFLKRNHSRQGTAIPQGEDSSQECGGCFFNGHWFPLTEWRSADIPVRSNSE